MSCLQWLCIFVPWKAKRECRVLSAHARFIANETL